MTKLENGIRNLDVTLYGNVETLTPTLSKCRVRIFYRGLNRNRTYISDDFAQQLIASMPYSPIKGIFNKEDIDFDDHGDNNSDGRIYGIIPENPNFAWEKHLDKDGVEREYACADVYLYTALYPEANLISGKSQSMEIHKEGLEGEWKIWNGDGQPYYEFYKGHLLGLQVLGDEVEPCFEGSAFFSLYKGAKELYDYIKNSKEKEESKKMEKNLFRLSDSEKCDLLWNALNTNADDYKIVCDIYDDYAIAYDANNGKYLRAYYTKDNDANTLTVDRIEDCYIVDVTEAEMTALNAMKAMGSFAEINAKLEEQTSQIDTFTANVASLEEQLAEANNKIAEFEAKAQEPVVDNNLEGEGSTEGAAEPSAEGATEPQVDNSLTEENEALKAQIEEFKNSVAEKDAEISRLNNSISDLNNEKSELENFKKNVDTEKKEDIIKEFSQHLSEEQITDFTAKMENYSVEDFKKEVCFAAYNSDTTMFSKKEDNDSSDFIHKNDADTKESGVLRLLNKHKGGNR